MSLNRKQFFKMGAVAALFGFGGKKAVQLYASSGGGHDEAKNKNTGVRHAMVIDSSKCKEGCTKCMDACHMAHNVPSHSDPEDEIKWIWKESAHDLFHEIDFALQGGALTAEKQLPTLCNHCANPPCVRVCPTQATFKRKEDGIVMMDYHRCIGCRFCMAGCPYGSRSFNYRDPREGLAKINPKFPTRKTGVVEKCNFCAEELAKGKRPHCEGACPEGAILFGNLNDPDSKLRAVLAANPSMRRKAETGTGPSIFYLTNDTDKKSKGGRS